MHIYIICIHYMCCFSLIGSWWLFTTHHSWDFSNYGRAPCRPSHPRSMDSSASECLRNLMDVTTKKGASLLAFHSHGEFLGWFISKSENWWELIPQVIWKPLETLSFGSLYPWNPLFFNGFHIRILVLLINVYSKYGIANPRKERRITFKKT